MLRRRPLLACAALALVQSTAQALDDPKGSAVLTLSGRIRHTNRHTNRSGEAAFDMAMLAQLPQHWFNVRTPWYDRARKFSGPLLRDLLAAVGSVGPSLRAVALNDYRVNIPADDAQRFDVLLATQLDDQPMAVRDKGPLFIIYPFDSHAELRNPVYYSRCAWQLKAIEVW